jgi:type VI protein secretion system component VasK
VNGLLGKFPFAPKSTVQASVAEVNQVFMPDTGLAWTILGGPLKGYLVPQGSGYVPAPNPPQPVNPKFATYFSHVAKISSNLYGVGAKSPTLKFSLKFIPTPGVNSATFVVDSQRIPMGSLRNDFNWDGTSAQRALLNLDGADTPVDYSGPWAVFQLVRAAQITKTPTGYRLDYPVSNSTLIAGHALNPASGMKTVSFELSGPGAGMLVGDDFSGLVCAPVVK